MKRQHLGDLIPCGILAAILVVCVMIASIVSIAVGSVVAALLAAEIDRSGRLIAVHIIRICSLILPRRVRSDYAEEWRDQVLSDGEEREAGLRPVITAIKLVTSGIPTILRREMQRTPNNRELARAYDRAICEVRRQSPGASGSPSGLTLLAALLGMPSAPFQAEFVARGYRGMSRTTMVVIGAIWWLTLLPQATGLGPVGAAPGGWWYSSAPYVAWAIVILVQTVAPLRWFNITSREGD